MKPKDYPLPWCDKLDMPYYAVNMYLINTVEGWSKKQAYKPMSEIIPWIDEILENSV